MTVAAINPSAVLRGVPFNWPCPSNTPQRSVVRMSMRRFTRLTNGFSKKIEYHVAMIALHIMYYNFCRLHQTLRVTPAMEAGISNHAWEISELLRLLA